MKKPFCRNIFLFLVILILAFSGNPLHARIVRVYVMKTEPYMDGRTFGNAGSYIKITGQVYGEVDPGDPLNNMIQDIVPP